MADKRSKAKAAWGEAKRSAAKKAKAAVEKVDEKTSDGASKAIDKGGTASKGVIETSQKATTSAVERMAGTDTGATTLDGAKKAFSTFASLPGVTLIGDGVQSRQGVGRLMERLRDDPFDPMPPVWLAEAMLKAQREQKGVNIVRAAVSPARIAMVGLATAVKDANEQQPAVPAPTQLLGRSYVLALARLDERLSTHDLHALSRVYLARGAPAEAVRLAQGAIAVGGDGVAEAAITLARAHGRNGSLPQAKAAAHLAVDLGSTLGHQILAELPDVHAEHGDTDAGRPGGDRPAVTTAQRAELHAKVETEDVERYRGAAPTVKGMAGDVLDQQRRRLKDQGPKVRAVGDRMKDRLRKEAGDDG